jgi:eukaryotic-like serine/threonine-protein kinase
MTESRSTDSAAYQLSGLRLDGGWVVGDRRELPVDQTGGAYSIGYTVRNDSGEEGFLKALDYSEALAGPDPARELQRLTVTFNAERDLLEWCGSRGLNRIVRALASGTTRVPGASPEVVNYLIFEVADGDARSAVTSRNPSDQLPMIWLAHNAAAAMSQLHVKLVMHQDVKPSNLLVWDRPEELRGKLGDLGSAYVEGRPAPHDEKLIAGDFAYASPELLYECSKSIGSPRRRQAGDIFMLGNLIVFLLVTVPYSGILNCNLDANQCWRRWTGSFEEVLPGLVDAHGRVLSTIRGALLAEFAEPMVSIIDELCHPDPARRGDPIARRHGQNPYDLGRYVTKLDLIYKRAKIAA